MPFDLFCRLVDETAPYVKSDSLFNWGESLVLKDFRERVLYVCSKRRADCEIDISINDMPLTDNMIGFLRSQNINVMVSFDGADKKTFEDIRRGANFRFICEKLKSLSEAYSNMSVLNSPEIYTSIQQDNQNQLLALYWMMKTYSVSCRRLWNVEQFISSKGWRLLMVGKQMCSQGQLHCCTSCNVPFINVSVAYNGDVFLYCNGGALARNVGIKVSKKYCKALLTTNCRKRLIPIPLCRKGAGLVHGLTSKSLAEIIYVLS